MRRIRPGAASIRRLACTAGLALTALAAAGVAAGSGSAGSEALVCNARAQERMTDAGLRALTIRSLALNRKHGLGTAK